MASSEISRCYILHLDVCHIYVTRETSAVYGMDFEQVHETSIGLNLS